MMVDENKIEQQVSLIREIGNLFEDQVYIKNIEGVYIYHNESMLKALKEDKIFHYNVCNFIGKTDYEIFSKSNADAFTKTDKIIIETKQEQKFEETVTLKEHIKRKFITFKKPLFDSDNNLIGILGCSADYTNIKINNFYISLSRREIQTLAGLYHGMSTRDVAKKLNLSARTIDDYYASVKGKMSVDTKNQLLELVHSKKFACILDYFYKGVLGHHSY